MMTWTKTKSVSIDNKKEWKILQKSNVKYLVIAG